MKWTTAEGAEFRALVEAGYGAVAISERMSKHPSGVKRYASMHGIQIVGRPLVGDLRARWAAMIGPMKEQLRADIGSM